MTDENPRDGTVAKDDSERRPAPPVSPTATVYDGDRVYNLAELRAALPEKEQDYFDDMRGRFRDAARRRTQDRNAKAPRGAEPLRYSKDVADAEAWRQYHHQHPHTAERAIAAVQPIGDAPERSADGEATAPAVPDPNLVKTTAGDELRFSDLRAYVQPIDARARPLDDIREQAERKTAELTPQEIWQRFEAREPDAAAAAERGVRQIQANIDAGRYPETSPAEVTQARFIDTAAYYLQKENTQPPAHREVLDDLRNHYRGWAKSEAAWSAYEERMGIHPPKSRAEGLQLEPGVPERTHDTTPSR